MASQVELALQGVITNEMIAAAKADFVTPEYVRDMVAEGKVVIPNNLGRASRSVGIGKGLRTKVNASIGTSTDIADIAMEIEKAKVAQACGADSLMELSVGGDIPRIRREILGAVELPVGTVPLYQAFAESIKKYGSPVDMPVEMLFDVIEEQCADGISFMAIHCGINRMTVERLRKQGYRYGGLVSKGGAYMVAWMLHNDRENPLFEQFDRVADILKKYDCVLSLGNGFRAGAIHDSSDRCQIQELVINCELAEEGRRMGCQMMVEGPGHIPIDEIEANIIIQKRMSNEAPFYVLGPITTDVAPGYDHITSAIGASLSSAYGADFICYVTPSEHLALPDVNDVKEGVMAARIAAHVGDMIKLKDRGLDREMSLARRGLDWKRQFELAITGDRPAEIRRSRMPENDDSCTMCGEFCATRIVTKYFEADIERGEKKLGAEAR
ncbi:MAG: phosphomethylpyrimidine synthase ThiC [Nitrospirae bacterium]|nr:phosphomethylpyrimidine synthase ThiC [Nitrospirota bacterium]MBI5695316.1 phosphomethylpyrimidine synthase ThiC [Nitrospirota bacterium]